MANNGLYTREDEVFFKKLLAHGVIEEELFRRFDFTNEQVIALQQACRKEFFRIFRVQKCGDIWLVDKDEYMKIMGYNDRIVTNGNILKIVSLADTHFGSINDIPGIMDKVENFCTGQGIEHVIHAGDVKEGTEYYVKKYTKGKCRCPLDEDGELKYLNKCLPYNKLTKKHLLLSNHDNFAHDGVSRDFVKQLHDKYGREDLIVSGFDFAELPVNGDKLYLNHGYIKDFSNFDFENEIRVYICGHSHRDLTRINLENGFVVMYLPPLSNIEHKNPNRSAEENNFFVGFKVLEIELNDNKSFNNMLVTTYKTSNSPYSKPEPLPHQDFIEFSRVRK